jgi:hypothetical protein
MIEPFAIPAVGRHLADAAASFGQECPKRFDILGAAWKSAANANDRQRRQRLAVRQ